MNIKLIYSNTMEDITMEPEYENNIPYADFSLNELQENPNDTIQEMFHYEVEKAIDCGADYLVIGRPITKSNNIKKSLNDIYESIQ